MGHKVYITSEMGLDEDLYAVAGEDWQAALLWPWILTDLDDWGRGLSDPRRVKKTTFPDWPGITAEYIAAALALFAKHELLFIYGDNGEYMAVEEEAWRRWQTHIRWDKKGKASSKFPPYPGSSRTIPEVPGSSRTIPEVPGSSRTIHPSPSPSPSNPPTPLTGRKRKRPVDNFTKEAKWHPSLEPFEAPGEDLTPEQREANARAARECAEKFRAMTGAKPELIGKEMA